jgi:asparagine synthase (glutamine-hydrolysing)
VIVKYFFPLIQDFGIMKTVDVINGDFAFVWTDGKRIMAARDPVGVRPMFYTRYESRTRLHFASEAKALVIFEIANSYISTGTHI